MGAHFVVHLAVGAFVKQVQVHLAHGGQKAVGIVKLTDVALAVERAQLIAKDLAAAGHKSLEDARLVDLLHGPAPLGLGLDIHHFAGFYLAQKGPHHHAVVALLRMRVHPQHRVRLGMLRQKKRLKIRRSDDHEAFIQTDGPSGVNGFVKNWKKRRVYARLKAAKSP